MVLKMQLIKPGRKINKMEIRSVVSYLFKPRPLLIDVRIGRPICILYNPGCLRLRVSFVISGPGGDATSRYLFVVKEKSEILEYACTDSSHDGRERSLAS